MEDLDFFGKIVNAYTVKGEKVIVYMDVNSTIICNDSVQGKDTAASLLGVMFECVQFKPKEAMDLDWEPFPKVKVDKAKTLKQLVKDMMSEAQGSYSGFGTE